MRRTTTLTALLLGATLLAPIGAATAAGETCRGEAATIVGTGPAVQGTDARDVIVTGPSVEVSAAGGDDLICVTGAGATFNLLSVDSGAGNDLVDSTAMPAAFLLSATLGDGADIFVGGAGSDRVSAGTAPGFPSATPSEAERDVIDTGDGSDAVVSGGPGLANNDEVRTGSGIDHVTWSGVMGAQGVLDGGTDFDQLVARASGQVFGIDLAAQTLSRDGVAEASFSSFEGFGVAPEPDLGTVEILGTESADDVEVYSPAAVRASLGDGNDSLRVATTKPGSRIDLGAGTDNIQATSRKGSAELDLGRRSMHMDAFASVPLIGAEHATVTAKQATVRGDSSANVLSAMGCLATINGRGGRDIIGHSFYDVETDAGFDCSNSGTKLIGGSGNDKIEGGSRADRIYGGGGNDKIKVGPARSGKNMAWGGRGNDQLQGGGDRDVLSGGAGEDTIGGKAGRDVAIGGPDRDRCRAEIERSCERH